jgi:hypothetical protein
VIVRIWEAWVAPDLADKFCATLTTEVMPTLDDVDGCLGAELLRSIDVDEVRVLMVSRWRDEAALRGYAGPMWRVRPVLAEEELPYLLKPPQVCHYEPPRAE